MKFFATDPLLDERASAAIGLARGLQYFKLIEPITGNAGRRLEVEGGFKEMERCWRREPGCRHGAELVYRSPYH